MVGERDGGQPRHRAVLVGGAHLHQTRDVGRFAGERERVEHVRVGAVEQEADHVVRSRRRRVEHVVERTTVLAGEEGAVGAGLDPEQRAHGGRDVDQPADTGHDAVAAHACAADHERRPGLHHTERPVLTAVPTCVLPVVGAGVHHAQVGCGGVIEQLGHLLEGEGIGVGGPGGVGIGQFGSQPRQAVGRLVGERILAVDGDHVVGPIAAGEPHRAVGRRHLIAIRLRRRQHHVDDRCQRRVEQDRQGSFPGRRHSRDATRHRRFHRLRSPTGVK